MSTAPPGGHADGPGPRSDADAVGEDRVGTVPPHLEREAQAVLQLRDSLMSPEPVPSAELAQLLGAGPALQPHPPTAALVGAE